MRKSIISMIFAMDRNQLIGKDNGLPWKIPADMSYFIKTTAGHTILMGRKTFESFGSKPLKNRKNIILTRDTDFKADGCLIVYSIEEAMELIAKEEAEEIFIIGGTQIYKLFLPYADRLYITHIEASFEGDSYFPTYDEEEWQVTSNEKGIKNDANPYDYYYKVYERK